MQTQVSWLLHTSDARSVPLLPQSRKQLQEKQANVLHAPITAAVVEKAASADKQLLDALAAEQEKAALRIQAAARGRAARTHVKALRAELTPQQQADEAAAAAAAASMVPEGVDLERLDEPIVVDALLQEGGAGAQLRLIGC